MKNFGWKHVLLLLLIYVSVYVIVVQESWLQETMAKEREFNHSFLGVDRAEAAELKTTEYFNLLFVRTGAMNKSFELFLPNQEQRDKTKGMETMGVEFFDWVEKRIRAGWTLIFQVMLRFFTALVWWPFMVLVLIPFLVDALVSRKVKATTFGLTSPHIQGLAVRAIPVVVIGYVMLMLAPMFMHPAWVPGLVFFSAGALWFGIAQFVKRG